MYKEPPPKAPPSMPEVCCLASTVTELQQPVCWKETCRHELPCCFITLGGKAPTHGQTMGPDSTSRPKSLLCYCSSIIGVAVYAQLPRMRFRCASFSQASRMQAGGGVSFNGGLVFYSRTRTQVPHCMQSRTFGQKRPKRLTSTFCRGESANLEETNRARARFWQLIHFLQSSARSASAPKLFCTSLIPSTRGLH